MEKIQSLLNSSERCLYCIDGSLVVGWTRTPHIFTIIQSEKTSYGLIIFSHPGIGSTDIEVKPKHAIPMDSNFRFMINNNTNSSVNSEIQLQLTSGSSSHIAEFTSNNTSKEFISAVTCIYQGSTHTTTHLSYDWLEWYRGNEKNSTTGENLDNWPWSELTKPADSTPVAFDSETDILHFDSLAPTITTANQSSKEDGFENIIVPTQRLNLENKTDGTPKTLSETDLKDFDPLSPTEIEQGIESEKMISAELLKRSRDVLSTRALAGKSWIERTLSQSNEKRITDVQNNKEILEDENEDFYDVTDNVDIKTIEGSDSYFSGVYSGSRSSAIFKGMRARENTIKLLMAAREKEFTELFPFTVFSGTWNVNGQAPTESLVPWLQSCSNPPDIVAIGFQELDLSAEALVFNDSSREDQWIKSIENGLPKSADYFKLKHVRLVGMMLVVFVQTKHKMQVNDVESETNGTGIMGMMGNKGGVAVRFQLHNSTICFVNSHLAAHLMEYERRNQDFREVYSKLKFTLFQPPLSISDHDMVFWLGDLNYRFDEMDAAEVKTCINKKDYSKLYSFDQLHRQRSAGKVFKGFFEGPILFRPTYKYDPGTDDWDSSEKARAPAWCDRILWKGKNIEQLKYQSHPGLKLSDHKPVSGVFSVGIKVVERSKERKVFEEIVRKLDKRENDSLPQVKLAKNEFQFVDVEFMETRYDTLPIANIGQAPVQFEFIPKLDENDLCKPWIKVDPVAGLIMPGDVLELELSIYVDKMSAPLVTMGNCRLDDILVLHLIDGKDFFVPINGSYKPSVFGSSLEALVRIYGPIRQLPMEKLLKLESTASSFDYMDGQSFPDATEPLEIPKELWLLIDHLHKYGMTQENVLVQSGIDEDIIKIRNHLDHGMGGTIPGSIFSIGEALLFFLEALPEPVIPYKYHSKCLEACNNYVLCKQVITQLPDCHATVFRYLTAFLRELLKESMENKLDPKVLATVFGTILLRSPLNQPKNQNRKMQAQISNKKAKFVFHFLVNDFRD